MQDDRPLPLALIDSDRRRLVRAATRLLGPADAEDAVQDAYVRALEAEQLELNAAQAWLLTVVRNLAIDRLRRRQWMQQWLEGMAASDTATAAPSAESDAALTQEATRALRLLAACLAPEDGAAVLLHEVFEASHAEIAQTTGRSEAASRQQLRRALLRLRRTGGVPAPHPHQAEREAGNETVLRLYVQSMQLRDPQTLWAMLRQPPIRALHGVRAAAAKAVSVQNEAAHPVTQCGVVQVGGQLGLVLTLDGVTLCVVPLGAHDECDAQAVLL
ncbi:MAG: sigma-70 family RNA polymerase sigma factor [Acidovorax sp.]|nr:sigma-70 family RNA polymerase sigma factor [Acidovorax sp.]